MRVNLLRRALLGSLLGGMTGLCAPSSPPVPISISANGLRFPTLVWGEAGARSVFLLHGFPQEPTVWSPIAQDLAADGYQVIAPWLRGYVPGNRQGPYAFSTFIEDVLGIADGLGLEKVDLAGFGIGGALAWMVAADHSDRVRSVLSIRYPHPAAFAASLLSSPEQRQKWAALQKQLGTGDAVQEAASLLGHHAAGLRQLLGGAGLPQPYLDRYVSRLKRQGALAAALSWNRAVSLDEFLRVPVVQVPSLLLWTEGPAVSRAAADLTRDYVHAQYQETVLPDGGHFLLETSPRSLLTPFHTWLSGTAGPGRVV